MPGDMSRQHARIGRSRAGIDNRQPRAGQRVHPPFAQHQRMGMTAAHQHQIPRQGQITLHQIASLSHIKRWILLTEPVRARHRHDQVVRGPWTGSSGISPPIYTRKGPKPVKRVTFYPKTPMYIPSLTLYRRSDSFAVAGSTPRARPPHKRSRQDSLRDPDYCRCPCPTGL